MGRKLLVTSALPYANGPIHLGHLVEYIQTDIWVRYMKLRGHDCLYFCADDAHGAPIMLRAEAEAIGAEQLVERIGREHRADFSDFLIEFDNYHSTHSEENRQLANDIYQQLKAAGHISQYPIQQLFDPLKGMFLADRYVTGACPRCQAAGQYGDNCEVCGATYSPTELGDPRSALSGAIPESRQSEHYFFRLADFQDFLHHWTRDGHLQTQVTNKLDEWFDSGLKDWDISRDAPYFGFQIPGATDKYFYVWLDAPIGYMASHWHYLQRQGQTVTLEAYRQRWAEREIIHFIGKDILYFHALFWPAMLHGSGYRTPEKVHAHGFLTVNGQKMSKSRGTFIDARTYLDHLDAEYLRYYFSAKLGPGIDDLDLNFDDLLQRVNSDLVGKLVNIASRTAGFIGKLSAGNLGPELADGAQYRRFVEVGDLIGGWYESREYSKATREIMALADLANQYIAEAKPWELAKLPGREADVRRICTQSLNLFRVLATYLQPVLPRLAERVADFLQLAGLDWEARRQPLLNHGIKPFQPLLRRAEPDAVTAILEATQQKQSKN